MPAVEIKKECVHHGITTHVVSKTKGRIREVCKKCRTQSVIKSRKDRKLLLVNYRGGKCELCGYNKCQNALDFHHLDPSKKDFGLSTKGMTKSLDKQINECMKCIVVCSNCHREIHAGLTKIPNDYVPTLNKDFLPILLKNTTKNCKYCTKEYIPKAKNQMYCSNECRGIHSRKS